MQDLQIICEGYSEQEFVKGVLAQYLFKNNLILSAPILKSPKTRNQSHKGGNITFERVRSYAEILLKQRSDRMITTFIDFYALSNDFPGYDKALKISDLYTKIKLLENEFSREINDPRVIPYFQLHEYETLYFADCDNFISVDPRINIIKQDFDQVNCDFANPEEINGGNITAPSKRIESFLKNIKLGYDKRVYAALYAEKCDIVLLRQKCKHFNEWIEKLLNIQQIKTI